MIATGILMIVGTQIAQADGPIRRWLRGGSRTVYTDPVVVQSQPTITYTDTQCVGPYCTTGVPRFATPSMVATRSPVVTQASAVQPTSISLPSEITEVESEAGGRFGRQVVKAAIAAQRAGTISRVDLIRIRVAMLSPAFRQQAEDLAVVQMAASGAETGFEYAEDGSIIRTAINWEGLAAFLEKLVPLILTLLKAFGV